MKEKEITNVMLVENLSLNQEISRHTKTVHEGQRNYKCESCEKSYVQSGYLKKHIKTIHEGSKDHKCGFCERAFSLASNLKSHIKRIHED